MERRAYGAFVQASTISLGVAYRWVWRAFAWAIDSRSPEAGCTNLVVTKHHDMPEFAFATLFVVRCNAHLRLGRKLVK